MAFMSVNAAELSARGISQPDFVLVTGDAYVDHPSFGAALIGRVLQAEGWSVGLIARPDPGSADAFRLCGQPRLAFLVTSGNIDSMVAKYTANRRLRSEDEYAPGGRTELCLRGDGRIVPVASGDPRKTVHARPDRATIAYAARCREAFKGVPVILGGIEASLRRLSHYDYWSDTVRRSILLDAKADLVVYGMGETAILEIARRLNAGESARSMEGVRGTVRWTSSDPVLPPGSFVELPTFEAVRDDARAFAESFRLQYLNSDARSALPLVERTEGRWVVQEPPALPLPARELDRVYGLHFEREAHPSCDAFGGVPGLAEVKFSIASSRGCFGACSFCSLAFHQGRVVQARSHDSILAEARSLAAMPDFKGYIHDVGGPTANFRKPACPGQAKKGACVDRRCLAPEPCPSLETDQGDYDALLRKLRRVPGVRKVFVRSGVRFDYLMLAPDDSLFRELVEHHVSGQLKVAPEHVSDRVLRLMGKPPRRVYEAFAEKFRSVNEELGLKQYLVPYFISAHPGATLDDAIELAEYLRDSGIAPEQVQDFYPTPGTLSTCMWRTGLDPLTMESVYVAKGDRERTMQRALLQYRKGENRALVLEALRMAGRTDLIGSGPDCLVR
ncbi:MAG: YgiQ family radical SAM protein [Spirochaetes bacterium]|nr:YgiQ family radical SAM protein [Spirochaetota bacterium]